MEKLLGAILNPWLKKKGKTMILIWRKKQRTQEA